MITIDKSDIQALCSEFSIETTPKGAMKTGNFRRWLAAGTEVFITHLPNTDFHDTVSTCVELQMQGMSVVPHVALRNFRDEMELRQGLDDLQRAGVKKMLLLAGALPQPKGCFESVAAFLKSNILETLDFEAVFFAGHPEGAPHIPQKMIEEAEAFKQGYALTYPRRYELITQFCFTATPIIAWSENLAAREIELPLRIGIPGVASVQSLLKHAQNCGIGASMNFLRTHSWNLRQLMRPRKPDALLCDLARFRRENPTTYLRKLHFYPLGGFEQTIRFIQAIEKGYFTLTDEGFNIFH